MAASESNLFARASKVVYIASLNKYFWTRVEDVGGNRKVLLFSWLNFKHKYFLGYCSFVTCHENMSFSGSSKIKYCCCCCCCCCWGKWVLFKGLFTRREGYPGMRVTLALTHFLFSLRCVYKAARVTWVGRLTYLRARVTLAGRLTFFLVESPGKAACRG